MTTFWWIVIIVTVLVIGSAAVYYTYFRRGRRGPASPEESYIEALRALLDGNNTLAFLKLKETVTYNSNNIDAYLRLAALLRQRGMYTKSLQLSSDLHLRETVSSSERAQILYNLATDYEYTKRYDSAEAILRQVSQISGQRAAAAQRLIGLYDKMSRWEDAFRSESDYLDSVKEKDKSSLAKYKLRIGSRLMEDGDFHKARIEFKEALKYDPMCTRAVVAIGEAYEKEGRLEDAVKSWRMIIDVNPKESDAVFEGLQRVLFELGQFGETENFYNKILEKDPDNFGALTGLATLSEKKGERQHAEELYLQILDAKPGYRPALIGLLKLYREQNKISEAAQVINRTVETLSTTDPQK